MTDQVSESSPLDLRLALSGGGYRAALFHLGALRRLNELGLLSQINHFSSVSGGSITLALLASRVGKLRAGQVIDTRKWNAEMSEPLHAFCSKNIRTIPLAAYYFTLCLWPKVATRLLEWNYERLLLSAKGLQLKDLPDWAAFDFNATELKFGVRFGFRRTGMVCHKVDRPPSKTKEIALAKAVTASSSFPPAFPPIVLDLSEFRQSPKTSENTEVYSTKNDQVTLTDGGVYDNLGLEPIWDRAGARDERDEVYILVSDGGATIKYQEPAGFFQKFRRYIGVSIDQVGILRKRWLRARDGDKADPLKGCCR
jgi:NTE family protein